mmetsp:Transcript_66593/g.138818  ORF Transcript_66593/g.138818 Transcript_66593/m.138818 type:complete len:226 (+) Transcript_66593:1567-2244(+)
MQLSCFGSTSCAGGCLCAGGPQLLWVVAAVCPQKRLSPHSASIWPWKPITLPACFVEICEHCSQTIVKEQDFCPLPVFCACKETVLLGKRRECCQQDYCRRIKATWAFVVGNPHVKQMCLAALGRCHAVSVGKDNNWLDLSTHFQLNHMEVGCVVHLDHVEVLSKLRFVRKVASPQKRIVKTVLQSPEGVDPYQGRLELRILRLIHQGVLHLQRQILLHSALGEL